MMAPIRTLALTLPLLVSLALALGRPTLVWAAATAPCDPACAAGAGPAGDTKSPCRCTSAETRVQELEQMRQEQERIRMNAAARIFAAEQAAQEYQRLREMNRDRAESAKQLKVGKMALLMAGITGSATLFTLYLDSKATGAEHRTWRPISAGLGGFTVFTGLLGVGYLVVGKRSSNHDVGLQVAPGRMLASMGWRFP